MEWFDYGCALLGRLVAVLAVLCVAGIAMDHFLTRIFKSLQVYQRVIEYFFHRKEFRQWLLDSRKDRK